MGLVAIDRMSKDFYTKTLQQNLEDTAAFIAHVRCYEPRPSRCC